MIEKKEIENNSIKEKIKVELKMLISNGEILLRNFKSKEQKINFSKEYQEWYTPSLKIVQLLAPDRYTEFIKYYEIDSKRKSIAIENYVIQDFLKGITSTSFATGSREQIVEINFGNQISIMNSLYSRIDNILSNISEKLYVEIQDVELRTAQELIKISLRAAGSLAGVILETYLQKIIKKHNIIISKKYPTIADMNEPLKNNDIIDLTVWRKISYLGDIRNICSHKKDIEPTKEQVQELINGVNWAIKNIF